MSEPAAVTLLRDRRSDTDRVLAVLRAAPNEWVSDLYRRTGVMVHSRVADLRHRGHRIECQRFGREDYRYRLITDGAALPGQTHQS